MHHTTKEWREQLRHKAWKLRKHTDHDVTRFAEETEILLDELESKLKDKEEESPCSEKS